MNQAAGSQFATAPAVLQDMIAATREAEYATLTRRGVPIANPLFHYYRPGAHSVDIATGLAYPAKADRARANPRVGLLLGPAVHARDPVAMIEHGAPDAAALTEQPVVVIAAMAAVRDSDIQANTDRYVRLFVSEHPMIGPDWEAMKSRLNYWARIWVECTPVRVLYWPKGLIDSEPPLVWQASDDAEFPASDPSPGGSPSPRARWPAEDWRARADRVLEHFPLPVLTVVDAAGFPLPFPVLAAGRTDAGFQLSLARHSPWEARGEACLSFGALATFVGRLQTVDGQTQFEVERLIGDLPSVFDTPQDQLDAMMERLDTELHRRGQPMPIVRLS